MPNLIIILILTQKFTEQNQTWWVSLRYKTTFWSSILKWNPDSDPDQDFDPEIKFAEQNQIRRVSLRYKNFFWYWISQSNPDLDPYKDPDPNEEGFGAKPIFVGTFKI